MMLLEFMLNMLARLDNVLDTESTPLPVRMLFKLKYGHCSNTALPSITNVVCFPVV